MSSLSLLMGGKASPREIERVIDRLGIVSSGNMSLATSNDVRVAAVQLFRKSYSSIADYIVDMNLYVSDAVNRRAQLVCFPAYTGVLPATVVPQFANSSAKLRPLASGLPDMDDFNDTLSFFSDFVYDLYYNTMSGLAARHGVYIMAGSTLYYDGDEPRHRAFLFDDHGDMIGFQDKISLNALEDSLQIDPAPELKIFETPLGGVAILICEDANYYEPARVAKNLGARLLVSPSVFTREYTPVDMALGLNMRVQENFIYGAQSVLVGDTGLGFTVEGSGCLFAPNELLMRKNGLMAQTTGRYEPDVACAKLDYDALDLSASPYTQDKNPEFMRKYLDRLY
jgi:predicted amidohydrolase